MDKIETKEIEIICEKINIEEKEKLPGNPNLNKRKEPEITTGNPTPQKKTCDIRNIFQNSKLQLEIKTQTKK